MDWRCLETRWVSDSISSFEVVSCWRLACRYGVPKVSVGGVEGDYVSSPKHKAVPHILAPFLALVFS